MKMEIRKFKHAEFLLLLPENEIEIKCMDHVFCKQLSLSSDSSPISAEICTSDSFEPYIRIKVKP
jgi:hypothetical protein